MRAGSSVSLISYIDRHFHLLQMTNPPLPKTTPDPVDPATLSTWHERAVSCGPSDLLLPDKADGEGELRNRFMVHHAVCADELQITGGSFVSARAVHSLRKDNDHHEFSFKP